MSSLEALRTRKYSAVGVVQTSRDDTPVVLRIRKIGSETATSVTVTTATNIVLVGSTTTDTFTFATYTTVGLLVNAINATGRWEAVVLDALRSDLTTASNFVTGAITAGTDGNGVVCYDVTADTSVNKFITASLSFNRNFDGPRRGHRANLREIRYNANVSAAEGNAVRVYSRVGATETQIAGYASVDATDTTVNWAAGQGYITVAEMGDIIVRVQDATSLTDGALNYLAITGLMEQFLVLLCMSLKSGLQAQGWNPYP